MSRTVASPPNGKHQSLAQRQPLAERQGHNGRWGRWVLVGGRERLKHSAYVGGLRVSVKLGLPALRHAGRHSLAALKVQLQKGRHGRARRLGYHSRR